MRSLAVTRTRANVNVLLLVYLVVGAVVAATHNYFENVDGWRQVVSAALAIVLWPLIYLGIDLHIRP